MSTPFNAIETNTVWREEMDRRINQFERQFEGNPIRDEFRETGSSTRFRLRTGSAMARLAAVPHALHHLVLSRLFRPHTTP
jgi:hypothetical protein